ncbi:hypothetical protein ETB97_007867 [Aspergillus alliaceus]|uniref:Uncharacterized protein n=1 Tax=Petromyces alliaceus TaxID=209559 RepID=A0A8H5ZVX4_PETAA|nr:hypothetical protein ETB97_007867 [Aspergillus burnettii]
MSPFLAAGHRDWAGLWEQPCYSLSDKSVALDQIVMALMCESTAYEVRVEKSLLQARRVSWMQDTVLVSMEVVAVGYESERNNERSVAEGLLLGKEEDMGEPELARCAAVCEEAKVEDDCQLHRLGEVV